MFHMDQTYAAAELAYRKERLTGHRDGERVHHVPTTRGRRLVRRSARARRVANVDAGGVMSARYWFQARGLVRARNGRWIGGVAAGIARRLDLRPSVVRAAWTISRSSSGGRRSCSPSRSGF